MIRSLRFAAGRAGALLWRGALIVVLSGLTMNVAVAINDAVDPIDASFKTVAIEVPDFCAGDDPLITVTRYSRAVMRGQYHSYYQRAGEATVPLLPYTSPIFEYKPKSDLVLTMILGDYMGRAPALPPGRYVAVVSHSFTRPWHGISYTERASNVFTVSDCKTE